MIKNGEGERARKLVDYDQIFGNYEEFKEIDLGFK
jgi:hypothetical protein